ncbi:hypothetical protein DFA_07235 [Cavenderia fasciculata]|uniref:Uncharacterized protein n=1 Tax=Cavenderia fasciculata TaxID=261658 RepID=F4PVV1_CACFS|nr:uncharacterized protein DFA_07235 [Cavenderia fasciculata]EGG20115.1 hypothetical protein DFA_07235 [Cavenderia fasciculata]|eukprot:XP_004367098.1 hypothetical protein DFA_07235 [Cavenderia fasciculata]
MEEEEPTHQFIKETINHFKYNGSYIGGFKKKATQRVIWLLYLVSNGMPPNKQTKHNDDDDSKSLNIIMIAQLLLKDNHEWNELIEFINNANQYENKIVRYNAFMLMFQSIRIVMQSKRLISSWLLSKMIQTFSSSLSTALLKERQNIDYNGTYPDDTQMAIEAILRYLTFVPISNSRGSFKHCK